jgi:hypothetical protein
MASRIGNGSIIHFLAKDGKRAVVYCNTDTCDDRVDFKSHFTITIVKYHNIMVVLAEMFGPHQAGGQRFLKICSDYHLCLSPIFRGPLSFSSSVVCAQLEQKSHCSGSFHFKCSFSMELTYSHFRNSCPTCLWWFKNRTKVKKSGNLWNAFLISELLQSASSIQYTHPGCTWYII